MSEKMEIQNRKHLLQSYERTYGNLPDADTSYSDFNDEQIERYRIHGLAKAVCEFPGARIHTEHFIIDTKPLQSITPPKYAWFSKILPDSVTVMVSSGKQHADRNALGLDPKRILEGLEIRFDYKVSPNQVPPFDVELMPLYRF